MEIKTICVCGAGTMGSGIAQVAAANGFSTIQFDINTNMLDKSKAAINAGLALQVSKGKIDAKKREEIIGLLTFTSEIGSCKADLVIEAIAEIPEAKVDLFNKLARVNEPSTIFSSNTSSLSISALAAQIPHPERFAGLHFFNPAVVMNLVEIVKGERTSDDVCNTLCTLAERLGKTHVVCKDLPGFIVNRVARPYYLEAMRIVEQGLCETALIDELMESAGFKMGPFKLMDLIGMDVNYSVSNIVWQALGEPERLRPSVLQHEKVEAGKLGRKTGEGFYHY